MKSQLLILALIVTGIAGYLLVRNQKMLHDRREAILDKLKGGTNKQVIAALGSPDRKSKDGHDEEWHYRSTHRWAESLWPLVRSDDALILFEGDRVENAFTEPE